MDVRKNCVKIAKTGSVKLHEHSRSHNSPARASNTHTDRFTGTETTLRATYVARGRIYTMRAGDVA